MELIQKQIRLIYTTATTETCTGTCRVFIPDTGVTYNLQFFLSAHKFDFGFFDAYSGDSTLSTGGNTETVSGIGTSRLSELKKYNVTGDFFSRYKSSSGIANDGVDSTRSDLSANPQKIVYYIGGVTYTDLIDDDGSVTTSFTFEGQGYNSPDFINSPIYKDPDKSNLVSNPKIDSDVFIIRQQLSVFDKNYKLKDISNLVDLTTYAGGRFFNIVSINNL